MGVSLLSGVAAVKFGGFAKIASATDPESRDLPLRAWVLATGADRRFWIVSRSGEPFIRMSAVPATVVEERHPDSSLVLLLKGRKLRV
jgi:hypothetical protein